MCDYEVEYGINDVWAASSEKVLSNMQKYAYSNHPAHVKTQTGLLSPFVHFVVVSNDSVADSVDPDQTAWVHMLILAFTICICPKTRCRVASPFKV